MTVSAAPLAAAEQVAQAEQVLGYPLPPFLVRLYREVGNGGFGPDYGLLGIAGGATDDRRHDALAAYEEYRQLDPDDPFWRWPPSLLPIINCGCAMYLCVDCSTPTGRIVWFEPNPHEDGESWDESFVRLPCDVEQLFEAWIEGRHWMKAFLPSEDEEP
jgi:hypothetical protein